MPVRVVVKLVMVVSGSTNMTGQVRKSIESGVSPNSKIVSVFPPFVMVNAAIDCARVTNCGALMSASYSGQ